MAFRIQLVDRDRILLHASPANAITITEVDEMNIPPAVIHSLRCTCEPCCDARRDEARARTEELAGRRAAFFEATMPLRKVRKPMPGSLPALRKLGRRSA